MHILVTGGSGYIGSHTVVELLSEGHSVTVIDNLCNSKVDSLLKISKITTKKLYKGIVKDKDFSFVEGDIRNRELLDSIFINNNIDLVIHFAGLKSIGESIENPLRYFDNNVNGTVILCKAMKTAGINRIIFSSSASVYGSPESVPINESFPTVANNPYGRSKLIIEEIFRDINNSESDWSIALLRYFNPVGAHKSYLIGENPSSIPNNLMPYIAKVASGELKKLKVFGNDYLTLDGTGIRDYIHVVDLAKGHMAAMDWLMHDSSRDILTVNLGTGNGYSVLEIISAFEFASGKKIPYEIVDRRPGDIAQSFADPSNAKKLLGWESKLDLNDMCIDSWNYQINQFT